MKIGNRIPETFFETTGTGESDVTIHAGSFHLALHDAGIEMANIMTYSSILPGTARRIAHPGREGITHGEVMESIVAQHSCGPGERATAAIIYTWLRDPKDGMILGGLVCEYGGEMSVEDVMPHMEDMLDELYFNGYQGYQRIGTRTIVETIVPRKAYGTAIAALCFTSYEVPLIDPLGVEQGVTT